MLIRTLYLFVVIFFLACNSSLNEVESKRPNILVILLDTLRADHLGVYGYERDTSPNLDQFARDNILFEYAITPAPWTPPAVASIFTGLYPSQHGMMPPNSRELAAGQSAILADSNITLAEQLKDLGYRTSAVSPNPWITADFNYNQGFDGFTYVARAAATVITDRAIRRLESFAKNKEQPFFLYLHYLDPHDPYRPPAQYAKMFDGQPLAHGSFEYPEKMANFINLYDGEIRYMDDELGKLFRYLKKNGLYEDMLIVIVGDHGEQFMERGNHTHGYQLYNEEVHVPMFLRLGSKTKKDMRIKEIASLVDIFPTLMAYLNVMPPAGLAGVNLADQAALASRSLVTSQIRRKYDQRAIVRVDRQKLILNTEYAENQTTVLQAEKNWQLGGKLLGLYDQHKDYFEQQPIEDKLLTKQMQQLLQAEFTGQVQGRAPVTDNKSSNISDDKLEQLRSLGYIN